MPSGNNNCTYYFRLQELPFSMKVSKDVRDQCDQMDAFVKKITQNPTHLCQSLCTTFYVAQTCGLHFQKFSHGKQLTIGRSIVQSGHSVGDESDHFFAKQIWQHEPHITRDGCAIGGKNGQKNLTAVIINRSMQAA
jgi:hypothetical protein